jgi:hypothetical protein
VGNVVEDFDPNKDIPTNVWAVFDGKFRTFKNRGPALNRVMAEYGPIKLCELVNGKWVVHVYKPRHNQDFGEAPCDVCADRPIAVSPYRRGPTAGPEYATGYWAWKREGGKITSPPQLLFVCYSCLQRVS